MARLLEFMVRLNEMAATRDSHGVEVPAEGTPPRRLRLVDAAIRHIDEHLSDDLSLDGIARACFVNKCHLSREFTRAMGITLGRFILLRRLQYAKRLLPQLASPKLVYRLCGFKSYTHFLHSFRQEVGMTTGEFIRSSQQLAGTGRSQEQFD